MNRLFACCLFLLLTATQIGIAQEGASSCAELQANFEQYQSCATNIPFQNSTNNTSGETFTTSCINLPFQGPTWFFMEINNPGDIFLQISQVNNGGGNSDVDFVLWGPFANMNNICNQLNLNKEVDCSWSESSIENVTLIDTEVGQLYILLVDNFSNLPGEITITQTGGDGSSDCSFLSSVEIKDTANNEITQLNYCQPDTLDIVATVDVADFPGNVADLRFNYKWYQDDILIATITNSLSSSNLLTVSESATYRVEMTAYDSTDLTVNVNTLPVSTDEIVLGFYDRPTLNSVPVQMEQCDYIAPNNDGIASVNLTQAYDALTNGTPGVSLQYYRDAALTQTIFSPQSYTNSNPFTETIYVTGVFALQPFLCVSNTATIALTINPTSVDSYPDVGPVCPDPATSLATIDFEAQRAAIKNAFFPTTDVGINFYNTPEDASLEVNALEASENFPVGITTVYARVETNNNCEGIGTFTVEVQAAPLQNTLTPILVCETETVLLNTKDAEALAGQEEFVQVSYFYSAAEAGNNNNPINKNTPLPLTVGTTTIYVRLLNTDTQCLAVTTFELQVFPNPTINDPNPIVQCGDGLADFDLTIRNAAITGGNPDYQVFYYVSQNDLNNDNPIPDSGSFNSPGQTLIVEVIDAANNNCATTTTLLLQIRQVPGSETNPDILQVCEATGFYTFDLTTNESQMVGNTPSGEIVFRYYTDLQDAENNTTNFISTPSAFTNTSAFYQKIYVRLTSNVNFDSESGLGCYRILEQELFARANPPNLLETTPYKICVDRDGNVVTQALIDAGLPEGDYDFLYYNGFDAQPGNHIITGNGRIFTTPFAGDYSVRITDLTNELLCTSVVNFTVVNSLVPFEVTGQPSELVAFGVDNTITAVATPASADYEYMLDSQGWQSSPVFSNIREGIYTLTVRNIFGCGEISNAIIVTDYPKLFTPNGDGYNDYWNIGGRIGVDALKVYVFDRYGKLLKDLSNNETGWDGTYLGNPAPADDYWFKVIYSKNGITGEYINHFTLKR